MMNKREKELALLGFVRGVKAVSPNPERDYNCTDEEAPYYEGGFVAGYAAKLVVLTILAAAGVPIATV